ncbi:MAG: putative alkylated repair protein [Actinomycetia bacterium]|nr:putative alkylated repair protein [Actinomycetes bacterium]
MSTDEPSYVDFSLEPERVWLDETSWVDVTRGFMPDSKAVYDALVQATNWKQGKVWRYERWLEEPRLGAFSPRGNPLHPAIAQAQRSIETRYRVKFDGVAFAYYRDQRDSVAFHRDREMRYLEETVVGILTLGAKRPFLVGPRGRRDKFLAANGGATHNLSPAGGDLMVFGGRFQADWEHAVPKAHQPLGGRISLQWRWTSKRGRPEVGANYRAPREFSRGRAR